MSETAVLPEPTVEVEAPPMALPIPAESPMPPRKERRFAANLRFNGFRYLTLACCVLSVWGLFEAGRLTCTRFLL